MKLSRLLLTVALIVGLLSACGSSETAAPAGDTILATTYPMYYLTQRLTEGMEDVTVELMVTEAVSCLHDYTLTTEQMKKIERADVIVMNGCGLEDFMADALKSVPEEKMIVAQKEGDPHYWLNPNAYMDACNKVCNRLNDMYPNQAITLDYNRMKLCDELVELFFELNEELTDLTCREMITFHDGFECFAQSLDLTIAAAIEEEEGAEASANDLKEICSLIEARSIPSIFVEANGSTNAAEIISRETGVKVYTLTTIMDGKADYFTAMRQNVEAVKEALDRKSVV